MTTTMKTYLPKRFTTVNVSPGYFEVYWDGVKTDWLIVNGSLGLSGRRTVNTYGIIKGGGTVKWVGPLTSAKKVVAYTLAKAAAL